jgi:hypothetical protein
VRLEPGDDEFLDQRFGTGVVKHLDRDGLALEPLDVQLGQRALERAHHELLCDARGLRSRRDRRQRAARQDETDKYDDEMPEGLETDHRRYLEVYDRLLEFSHAP